MSERHGFPTGAMPIELDPESVPEFEITDPSIGAVRYLEHGYPSSLVRWHCHNEYELHFIAASSGKAFVGDYIGPFRPGHLVLTGPRLPHNWICTPDSGQTFALRDMVVHFEYATLVGAAEYIPELRSLLPLLERARRGIEFHGMEATANRFMKAIRASAGPERFGHFCQFMHELSSCTDCEDLSTLPFDTLTDEAGLDKVNTVINFVTKHYRESIPLGRAAELVGMSDAYFSRFFRKATGNAFSEFLTRMRISRACELLSATDQQITSICYEVGYNNVANFNRRFLELKRITPREYRQQAHQRLTRGGPESEPGRFG